LDWFFKEWFYTPKVPDYEVGNLSVTQRDDKYFLTFEIVDKNNFTMPLEVEVMTSSREKVVKKVWIKGRTKVHFELNDAPTKIILDPNEWMVNENKKYNVEGIEIIVE
ncbi:MAG: aminopeptidase, partial [Palaeococcus sp.]|nr:aminopeptidase [Palaeococcus sp. (in: euryarchaeotes)]